MMDKPTEILLQIVITLVFPIVIGKLYRKIINVRIFRYKSRLAFENAVFNNQTLPEETRQLLQIKYYLAKPSLFRLLLTRRPLEIDQWFNQEEIDAFFLDASNCGRI